MNDEMLHAYFDGELNEVDTAKVEHRISVDADAARRYAELKAVHAALDGLEGWAGPAQFTDDVCAAARPRRGTLLRWALPLAVAAAAVFGLSVLFGGGNGPDSETVIDQQDYIEYVWEADAETYGSLALDDLEAQILEELEAT
ncbi:MAG: hypothetical protein OER88_03045 [Planctomycetota bacterium]|nr:hypothetical protein [Planctomycetota bacterium]